MGRWRRMLPLLLLCLCVCMYWVAVGGHCPCSSHTRTKTFHDGNRTLCVVTPSDPNAEIARTIKAHFPTGVKLLSHVSEATKPLCSMVLEVGGDIRNASRILCPGVCYPFRRVTLPVSVFHIKPTDLKEAEIPEYALTCSVTLRTLVGQYQAMPPASAPHWVEFLVRAVHQRHLQECSEAMALSQLVDDSAGRASLHLPRRRVDSVVIWIGSMERYQRMETQHTSLSAQPFHSAHSAVLGWAASDRLYPCSNTTRCLGNHRKYAGLLPKSDINFMPPGWGCAQRRPLRSLAHALLLLDPNFIVLLDDDTFLNFSLLQERFGSLLRHNLTAESAYLGEPMGRTGDSGHVSRIGFFVGGSGYVLGRRVLQRLAAKEVAAFGYENKVMENLRLAQRDVQGAIRSDEYRSAAQVWHLSVLGEGIGLAQKHCHDRLLDQALPDLDAAFASPATPAAAAHEPPTVSPSPCVQIEESLLNRTVVPIAVRLVDFCTNLMANEHTCHHRCLVYGALARPIPVTCHAEGEDRDRDALLGMCFMAPTCDPTRHVTCHRYEALVTGAGRLGVSRTSRSVGHYKHYSSVLKGNVSDTFL